MMGMGVTELILILVVVLIIFGAGKLPEVGDALGKGIKSFRKSVKEPDKNAEDGSDDEEKDDSPS